MGIREEQKQKRYMEILQAGLDLFIRRGYAATKISDIAQSVGMSTGLLFHYFPSKEKLYEQLIEYGIQGPMGIMAQADEEPLRFFQKAAEQVLRYIRSEPFTAKMFVLMSQAYYNEAAPQSVREKLAGFDMYAPTARLMALGQEQGAIREGDPKALAVAFWCAIQGIAEEVALNPDAPCPESDWIIDIIRRRET